MKTPLLLLLLVPTLSTARTCLSEWDDFRVEACTYGSLVEVINNRLPDDCPHDGATELKAYLNVGNLKPTLAAVCATAWELLTQTSFTDVDPRFDDTFMTQYVAGDTFLNEETGSLQDTVEGDNIDDFRRDEAKKTVVQGFPAIESCQHHSIMCCFGRDRQPNDNNGNCAEPLETNCVDADPADNSNLCYIDDGTTFLGEAEDDVHCHGLAWSMDENDVSSRLKYNNFFYVSLYDHLYQRGYVENMVDSDDVPMCGCIEDMAPVSRADCTELDARLTFTITFEGNTITAMPSETLDVDFNSCQGVNPRTGGSEGNDLASHVHKLYLEGKLTENTQEAVFATLVGHDQPDENHNEAACARSYEETFGAPYCSDTECVFFATDTQVSQGSPDIPYYSTGLREIISVDLQDGGGETQALLKFPSLSLPPEVTRVYSAELEMYTTNGSPGTIRGYRMIQPWTADDATWNSFGGNGVNENDSEARSTMSFEYTAPPVNQYLQLDVTDDVMDWLGVGVIANEGWVILMDSTDGWDFRNSHSGTGPKLTVHFTTAPVAPTLAPVAPTFAPTPTPAPVAPTTCVPVDESYAAVDTQVYESKPEDSYGTATTLSVDRLDGAGEVQALLKFPTLALPHPDALVETATLTFQTVNPTGGRIEGYRMVQPWTDDVTWNFWGGDGIQPNDVEARSVESFARTGMPAGVSSLDVTNDVIAWLEYGESNEGWALINVNTDGWDFTAAESATGPTLTVHYECLGGANQRPRSTPAPVVTRVTPAPVVTPAPIVTQAPITPTSAPITPAPTPTPAPELFFVETFDDLVDLSQHYNPSNLTEKGMYLPTPLAASPEDYCLRLRKSQSLVRTTWIPFATGAHLTLDVEAFLEHYGPAEGVAVETKWKGENTTWIERGRWTLDDVPASTWTSLSVEIPNDEDAHKMKFRFLNLADDKKKRVYLNNLRLSSRAGETTAR